jgi:signal transduction histidine kinase
MKNDPLEPGLLSIFRLFLLIQLGLIVLGVLAYMHRGDLSGCPFCIMAVAVAGILLLIGYLSWPWLATQLGRLYLPVALAFAVFIPLLVQSELIQLFPNPQDFGSDEIAWQIFLFLFFPLVLVAWQYNFRKVILYTFLSSGLEVLILHMGNYTWFHQTSYPRSMSVRTVVFLAAGYVIALIMRRQREQRRSLIEANRQLSHYAATLEQLATTQERNRMARELHDTLAHTLSALAVQLEAVRSIWQSSPSQACAMLDDALATTRSGLGETRKAILDLRVSPIEDLGLYQAIHDLAEAAASRAGASLRLDMPPTIDKLSPDIEQCLFRVAQEALENVVRHSEAHQLCLQLAREDSHLVLVVSDDGRGFDAGRAAGQGCFGLKGMRERVEMLGGDLDIRSQQGQGTTIRLTLELAR